MKKSLLYIVSLIIMCCAQVGVSTSACITASFCALALFWKSMECVTTRQKYFLSVLWYFSWTLVHHLWIFSNPQHGLYILVLIVSLPFFYGVTSLLIPREVTLLSAARIAATFVLIEWVAIEGLSYVLGLGNLFDLMGIFVTSTLLGMQSVSLLGLYGLTFFVIFMNILIYGKKWRWAPLALVPYLFGLLQLTLPITEDSLDVTLVQTGINSHHPASHADVVLQWEQYAKWLQGTSSSLVIFPESAFSFSNDERVEREELSKELSFLPQKDMYTHLDFGEALSSYLGAELIFPMLYVSETAISNAVFHIDKEGVVARYDKRRLLPVSEGKIPCLPWIKGGLRRGTLSNIFSLNRGRAALSICYEECFFHRMEERPDFLVNVSNDGWFRNSHLPYLHFHAGRLRAIEQGLPALRACNTGVSCGIDAYGRLVAALPYERWRAPAGGEILTLSLPLAQHRTLFSYVGNLPMLALSCLLLFPLPKNRILGYSLWHYGAPTADTQKKSLFFRYWDS